MKIFMVVFQMRLHLQPPTQTADSNIEKLSLQLIFRLEVFHAIFQSNVSDKHFIDVFPPAGYVFAICLPLFLQFQCQVVDFLMEISV